MDEKVIRQEGPGTERGSEVDWQIDGWADRDGKREEDLEFVIYN